MKQHIEAQDQKIQELKRENEGLRTEQEAIRRMVEEIRIDMKQRQEQQDQPLDWISNQRMILKWPI